MNAAKYIKDNRGSALISVFMIVMLLILLGMGILILSMSNTKQAVTTDVYERDYYVADGGAKQGVEVLRSAALEQYRKITEDLENSVESSNTAASFFAALDAVSYTPPQPDASAGGPNSNTVTISHTAVDSDTHRYSVLSNATNGTTQRSLLGSFTINFVPVAVVDHSFTPPGNQTIIAGGAFRQNSGWCAAKGSILFGSFSSYNPGQFSYNGVTNPDPATFTGTPVLNWHMVYPGFTLDPNVAITSGNLTVTGPVSGTASNYRKIYCSGNMTVKSGDLNYVELYCGGTLNMSNGADATNCRLYSGGSANLQVIINNDLIITGGNLTLTGNGADNDTIYCNGTVSFDSNTRNDMKIYCKDFTCSGGGIGDTTIIYAENSLHLEKTCHGIFYTNGSMTISDGGGITGQVIAKGNITLNGSQNFYPPDASLANWTLNSFVTSSPAPGYVTYTPPKDSAVFGNPSYSEQ